MLRCPNCKSDAGFLIDVNVIQSFDKYGNCEGNYEEPRVSPYSMCTCVDCDHDGIVLDFQDTRMEECDATDNKQD